MITKETKDRFKSIINIIWDSTKNAFELYNMITDPGEREDVIKREPAVSEKLKEALVAFIKRKSLNGHDLNSLKPSNIFRLDEDMKKNLRALGYIK